MGSGPNLGRYLTLAGRNPPVVMPELMPDWWPLLRAAKYLGVPPWELAKVSAYWRNIANEAASAEARAESGSDYSSSQPSP